MAEKIEEKITNVTTREYWEGFTNLKLDQLTEFPLQAFGSSTKKTLSSFFKDSTTDSDNLSRKNNWLLTGIVSSEPRVACGNHGNSYLYFDMIDTETLSYKTPVIVNLNLNFKYQKDPDLSEYLLPKMLDVLIICQPSLIPGNENYSRSALFVGAHYLNKKNSIVLTKKGEIPKKELVKIQEGSCLLVLGATSFFNNCFVSACKIILRPPNKMCDVHLSEKFSRLKGQRPEIASNAWGFNLFEMRDLSKKADSSHICSQYTEIPGRETFLLDTEEILTLYPSSKKVLTSAQLKEQQDKMNKIRGELAKIENPGGFMLKETNQDDQPFKKKKVDKTDPKNGRLSVTDCSDKAKLLLLKMKNDGASIGPKIQLTTKNFGSKFKKL